MLKRIMAVGCLTWLCALVVPAQQVTGSAQQVTGKILSMEDSTALAGADMRLVDGKKINYLDKRISEADGSFTLSYAGYDGTGGFLQVSMPGYESVLDSVTLDGKPVVVYLRRKSVTLGEATVSATRYRPTPTGYVYNVAGMEQLAPYPSTAVLSFLPGIIEQNGSLKVNGRQVSTIYINGRKVENPVELQAIVGEMMSSVEVDFWEGGDLTDGGSSASIRISLKKLPDGGYYGRLSTQYLLPPHSSNDAGRETPNGIVNYKNGKWNIYDFSTTHIRASAGKRKSTCRARRTERRTRPT